MTRSKLHGNRDHELLRQARESNVQAIDLIGALTDGRPLSSGQMYQVLTQIAVALAQQAECLREMNEIRRVESGRHRRYRHDPPKDPPA